MPVQPMILSAEQQAALLSNPMFMTSQQQTMSVSYPQPQTGQCNKQQPNVLPYNNFMPDWKYYSKEYPK